MKFKKALKLIKAGCNEEDCYPGICPLAVRMDRGSGCIMSLENLDEWDINKINKRFKKWAKKNAKKRK